MMGSPTLLVEQLNRQQWHVVCRGKTIIGATTWLQAVLNSLALADVMTPRHAVISQDLDGLALTLVLREPVA